MSYRQRLAAAAPGKETVVTIGVFDGVHQGHRHLLRQVVELAGDQYVPTVVTFSNRPITVLRPGTEPSYLTTLDQRMDLIKEQGIQTVISLEFTLELAQVTAADFANGLSESLMMKGLIFGPRLRRWQRPTGRPSLHATTRRAIGLLGAVRGYLGD